MEIESTKIEGLYIIKPRIFNDNRGKFIKVYHEKNFNDVGLNVDFVESYYSISNKNVIRGMHFQILPESHNKLVYVPAGKIIDVILDLRKKSITFGKFETFELSSENGHYVFIPKGCAHGFISLEDNTNVTYMQTTMYNEKCDKGIAYDSFGMDWKIENPIISERDLNFPDYTKTDIYF
jgi:dTDP-4-dehydrorhamnose 3,5-epimerase